MDRYKITLKQNRLNFYFNSIFQVDSLEKKFYLYLRKIKDALINYRKNILGAKAVIY